MSQAFLKIPLRIEGLFLTEDQQVCSPLADFTRLPWNNGTEDLNFDQPYVGDGIMHQPFGTQNLLLGAGVHLHFIVPHYLGRHIPKNSGLSDAGQLPAAPNRWLITKSVAGKITQWVVESDFVYPADYVPDDPGCIIPFHQGQPWRYMGRTTLLSDPRPTGDTFPSLNSNKPLTVVGFGDLNFSSFYPNCLGVFGFFDPDGKPEADATYSVLGWNDQAADDLLNRTVSKLLADQSKVDAEDISKQLFTLFGLELNIDGVTINPSSVPRSVFYGEFKADAAPDIQKPKLKLSIGNTASEALSALLANQLTPLGNPGKINIEDQLESMLLFGQLDHLHTDTGPKFLEARHQKGFHALHSGHAWRLVQPTENPKGEPGETAQSLPELPTDLIAPLDQLNNAQAVFDQATFEIATLRSQLYADWYKYMQARYPYIEGRGQFPDADRIMHFIESQSMVELDSVIAATGQASYGDESTNFQPRPKVVGGTDLANRLALAWQGLSAVLATENASRKTNKQPLLSLSMAPGPRYWQPNAPVILVSGLESGSAADTTASKQALSCELASTTQTATAESLANQNAGDLLVQWKGKNAVALSAQHWNPFILDWEVDLVDTHLQQAGGTVDPTGLSSNFEVNQFGPDLQQATGYQAGNLSVISGSVLMSGHAGSTLRAGLKAFLEASLKQAGIGFKSGKTIDDFLAASNWVDAFSRLNNTGNTLPAKEDVTANPLCTAWAAYQLLLSGHSLAQSLNGFNEACLMQQKTAQLPVKEPIGFDYQQQFSNLVNQAVGNHRSTSPLPDFDFNPVRSGGLKLNRLSLIDNFGLPHNLDTSQTPVAAEPLRDQKGEPFLLPRLAQPARLSFRWLAADDATLEMNDHVGTSPICGWLMADYLDESLAVYAADGQALGFIDASGTWNVLPWANRIANIQTNIGNAHLASVTTRLCSSKDFFQDFITATQGAQNNIAPTNAALYNTKAQLMGKPMAVVRAELAFELMGLPALNQSWPALMADLEQSQSGSLRTYSQRHNNNWTDLQLPIRLGEHHQLNDGLIGYWAEDASGNLNEDFIAPETISGSLSNAHITAFSDANHQTQWLALNGNPLRVSLIIDPHGLVHATSGLLPVKALSIPPSHYLPALHKLRMWFRTAPILQPAVQGETKRTLDLPPVNGFQWQWWDAFNGTQAIQAEGNTSTNEATAQVLDGWLSLVPDNQ